MRLLSEYPAPIKKLECHGEKEGGELVKGPCMFSNLNVLLARRIIEYRDCKNPNPMLTRVKNGGLGNRIAGKLRFSLNAQDRRHRPDEPCFYLY